jgi:hypothetical protein
LRNETQQLTSKALKIEDLRLKIENFPSQPTPSGIEWREFRVEEKTNSNFYVIELTIGRWGGVPHPSPLNPHPFFMNCYG